MLRDNGHSIGHMGEINDAAAMRIYVEPNTRYSHDPHAQNPIYPKPYVPVGDAAHLYRHRGAFRAVYVEYRKAGYSKKFRELHEADILLHQTAKKTFDDLGLKRLPTVASLRVEYAPMLEEKKAYREYQQAKDAIRNSYLTRMRCDNKRIHFDQEVVDTLT